MTVSVNPWWVQRWQNALGALGIGGQQRPPNMRVKRLEALPGAVNARVQDRELGECSVEWQITPFSAAQWQQIILRLSGQAIFAAQLLAGQLPAEIDLILREVGASLAPATVAELETRCSCGSISGGAISDAAPARCSHSAVVATALLEMMQNDPWLIFLLRGRERAEILDHLRQQRNETHPPLLRQAATSGAEMAPDAASASLFHMTSGLSVLGEEAAPLTAQLEHYWGRSRLLRTLQHRLTPPSIELALLRRLGAISNEAEWQPIEAELASLYRRVSEQALNLAYAAEGEEENA